MKERDQFIAESKLSAKRDVSEKMLKTCGAVLLYAIPMVLISTLYTAGLGIQSVEDILSLPAMRIAQCSAAYLAARLLILEPMLYGLLRWLAIRSDGLDCPVWEIAVCFGSVTDYFRAVRAGLCMALYKILWCVVMMIPVTLAAMLYSAVSLSLTGILFYAVLVYAVAVYLAMLLRYYGAYLLLSESDTLGVWKAFRQSVQVFRGHNRTMMMLLFSFAAWLLLTAFTDGLAGIYVYPYIVLSVFHLFRTLRGEKKERHYTEGGANGI